MKLFELYESRMAELDDIFSRAEALAYDEAHAQHSPVNGDRIFVIAKQIIHKEVRDPAIATAMIDAVSDRISQEYRF